MSKIDSIDFDIFDLDDIVGKKTTIYIASEILMKFDLVEKEIIQDNILKNFIETIVNGYDREKHYIIMIYMAVMLCKQYLQCLLKENFNQKCY